MTSHFSCDSCHCVRTFDEGVRFNELTFCESCWQLVLAEAHDPADEEITDQNTAWWCAMLTAAGVTSPEARAAVERWVN